MTNLPLQIFHLIICTVPYLLCSLEPKSTPKISWWWGGTELVKWTDVHTRIHDGGLEPSCWNKHNNIERFCNCPINPTSLGCNIWDESLETHRMFFITFYVRCIKVKNLWEDQHLSLRKFIIGLELLHYFQTLL